jgi:hypothetical protein
MSASERPSKQAAVRVKQAPAAVPHRPVNPFISQPIEQTGFTPATLIHLQRAVGNHAVQRMIGGIPTSPAHAETTESSDAGATIQRAIKPLPGASSGWFRKGRRDKINAMVEAYNTLEIQSSGSKRTVESYQKLLPEIQKIWQAAHEWQLDVRAKHPDKAEEIGDWMKKEVEREEDAKKGQIGELQQALALKAASDGAAYNVAYTTAEYTGATAGARWLATPALAAIYKYFLIQVQFEASTLYAYEDVTAYRQNPSRGEALRIYDKYDMGTASQLNITGEGAGGEEAVNAVRAQIQTLRNNPNAAAPANFGAIEKSLINVINELFIAFRSTTPYKKVTTPPAAG